MLTLSLELLKAIKISYLPDRLLLFLKPTILFSLLLFFSKKNPNFLMIAYKKILSSIDDLDSSLFFNVS